MFFFEDADTARTVSRVASQDLIYRDFSAQVNKSGPTTMSCALISWILAATVVAKVSHIS